MVPLGTGDLCLLVCMSSCSAAVVCYVCYLCVVVRCCITVFAFTHCMDGASSNDATTTTTNNNNNDNNHTDNENNRSSNNANAIAQEQRLTAPPLNI